MRLTQRVNAKLRKCSGLLTTKSLGPYILQSRFIAAIRRGRVGKSGELLTKMEGYDKQSVQKTFSIQGLNLKIPSIVKPIECLGHEDAVVAWKQINAFLRLASPDYDSILFDSKYVFESKNTHRFQYKKEDFSKWNINLFIRKNWWEDCKATREHELGPRFFRGFQNLGCTVSLREPKERSLYSSNDHFSSGYKKRIAFVDLQSKIFNYETGDSVRFFEGIRSNNDIIVALLFDYWKPEVKARLLVFKEYIDFIWYMGPAEYFGAEWNKKSITIPFMIGLTESQIRRYRSHVSSHKIQFVGGMEDTNYSRIYWKAATYDANQVFEMCRSDLANDGLDGYESYLRYLERMSLSKGCLNFVRRTDGSRIFNGRIQEAMTLGRFLVTEALPDLSRYYRPSEHYLDFVTLSDLDCINKKIILNEIDFDKIVTSATEYHDAHYLDIKIAENLSHMFSG